ncbi:MAG TPA: YciI family protein [Polyangiaceae bacterium]|nr:YciI family protein [Polyangiaceae bacterium]
MTTYALLIYRTSPPSVEISELDEEQALAHHRALQAEAARRKDLHAVVRLDAPRTARTVRARATGHDVTDGPFIESKEWLIGFYVVDCENEQQALARARQICADEHHAIEVRPVDWRWRS